MTKSARAFFLSKGICASIRFRASSASRPSRVCKRWTWMDLSQETTTLGRVTLKNPVSKRSGISITVMGRKASHWRETLRRISNRIGRCVAVLRLLRAEGLRNTSAARASLSSSPSTFTMFSLRNAAITLLYPHRPWRTMTRREGAREEDEEKAKIGGERWIEQRKIKRHRKQCTIKCKWSHTEHQMTKTHFLYDSTSDLVAVDHFDPKLFSQQTAHGGFTASYATSQSHKLHISFVINYNTRKIRILPTDREEKPPKCRKVLSCACNHACRRYLFVSIYFRIQSVIRSNTGRFSIENLV